MDEFFRVDRSVIKKVKLQELESDLNFWQSQPFEFRLETLENIREEYNSWKYGPGQRFQRVYKIIRRP